MDWNLIANIAPIAQLVGISAADLARWYRQSSAVEEKRLQDDVEAARQQAARQAIASGLIVDALRELYRTPDLSMYSLQWWDEPSAGMASAVVSRPSWRPARQELHEAVVSSLRDEPVLFSDVVARKVVESRVRLEPESFFDGTEVAGILARLDRRGIRYWDAPIFRLVALDESGPSLKLQFSLDRFIRYRLSYGNLMDELLQALLDVENNLEQLVQTRAELMPMRHRLLNSADRLLALPETLCAGGVAVMVAFRRGAPFNDYVIPIQRRASSVSAGQEMLSLLPQAFHQPTVDPHSEISLRATVFREIFEELLGGDEVEKSGPRLRSDWFFDTSPPLRWFLEHEGAFHLEFLGLARNLLNGNYECGVLLAVNDSAYWREYSHHLTANWEVKDAKAPFISTRDTVAIERLVRDRSWTEAVVFLCAGLRRLGEIGGKFILLPEGLS